MTRRTEKRDNCCCGSGHGQRCRAAINFNVDWVQLGVKFAAETVFLTVALCVMLNQQKLPWKFPALFASVLFACALIQIPTPAWWFPSWRFWLCITKVIKARTFTDAIVAVGVAFAAFAVFNFVVLTFALGFLHHALLVRARARIQARRHQRRRNGCRACHTDE